METLSFVTLKDYNHRRFITERQERTLIRISFKSLHHAKSPFGTGAFLRTPENWVEDPYQHSKCYCSALTSYEPVRARRYSRRESGSTDVLLCDWPPKIVDGRLLDTCSPLCPRRRWWCSSVRSPPGESTGDVDCTSLYLPGPRIRAYGISQR